MNSFLNRRQFLNHLGTGAVAFGLCGTAVAATKKPAKATALTVELAPAAFRPLPLGSIQPEGWLRRELQLQAEGLTGHLDEFWPDVAESQWFGGKAEGWERAPYWLDGFIPLAWVLGDQRLKDKARARVDYIVAHQRPDGWYSPYPADAKAKKYDLWSILLINKVLVQYHEATGDAKVLDAVLRNLKATLATLDATPLFDWGRFRWYEGLIPVFYAYEATREPWLLDLARKFREQGFDYRAYYAGNDIKVPTPSRGKWTFEKHVVNTAMALKAYALSWRLTRDEQERVYGHQMLRILDRYHGQVTGMFSGDECLSGPSPLQGTELCAVVEALYSLAQVIAVTGDPVYGDRWERIAYNALPAALAPDHWSHQYDQQVNQVQCTINPDHQWSTNNADSNLFGLEPHYGCCTSNLHQGWPKFAAHLWMQAPEDGLVALGYAPCTVRTRVRGTPVTITAETDYPFREQVRLVVTTERAVRFPLRLRIPGWAVGASLRAGTGKETAAKSGTFHVVNRRWTGKTVLELRLPMKPKTSRRFNEALSIERGPLVYSLRLGEAWNRVNADKPHRELPHGDFEVRPTTAWNYGLLVDEAKPETSLTFAEKPVGNRPFSPEGAGMEARAKGRKLPQWKLEKGWAAPVPTGTQHSTEPLEDLTLIPYGCAKLRVTEFPRL
jgi:DUF1680 family protein